jgi:predicted transposase/invertase (TIGR01784 family)
MDQAIRKAQGVILVIPHDVEIYRRYQMRELAMLDYYNSIYSAKKEGEQKERQKHVLKLSQNGFSAAEISRFIDLSVEEIEKILKNC